MRIMGDPRTLNVSVTIDHMLVGGETLVDECYSVLPNEGEDERHFAAELLREMADKLEEHR